MSRKEKTLFTWRKVQSFGFFLVFGSAWIWDHKAILQLWWENSKIPTKLYSLHSFLNRSLNLILLTIKNRFLGFFKSLLNVFPSTLSSLRATQQKHRVHVPAQLFSFFYFFSFFFRCCLSFLLTFVLKMCMCICENHLPFFFLFVNKPIFTFFKALKNYFSLLFAIFVWRLWALEIHHLHHR